MDGSRMLQTDMLEWTNGARGVLVVAVVGLFLVVMTMKLVRRIGSRDFYMLVTRIFAAAGRWRQRFNLTAVHSLLTLAGVRIAPLDETKHFKLSGTTGTGKSTAIRELLRCALARGDRAVFVVFFVGFLLVFF